MSNMLLDMESISNHEIQPFFKALKEAKSSKPKLHEWMKLAFDALSDESVRRKSVQKENLLLYRGVTQQQLVKWYAPNGDNNSRKFSRFQKFVINHLYDLTETKVSQMTRLKPAVQIMPTNDEWRDRASAKVVKTLIDHLWYVNNVDFLMQKMHRHARIFGESYAFITWDENAGDLHPAYVEARDLNLESIDLSNGKKFKLDKPIMTGDIKYELELPWRVLLQRKDCLENVEYCFRIKLEETEKLKADFPRNDIESDDMVSVFDIENLDEKFVEKHTMVVEFFHKKTKYVPEGYYCKFTMKEILESSDLPYSDGLPFIRLTDLDVPEVLNGVSRYETISNIQNMYNNLSTLIAKNIYLTAHAKWVMPRGAAKLEQLGNDNTVVQFQGPVPPQMIQTRPNPPEVYQFREMLKNEMQVIYGSHGISRGEVPKGITAASALQFLNELESERATTDIAKHNFLVRDLALKSISTAGDFYKPDDGRMVRIVGENDKFLIRHFDNAHLNKAYDIRVENSTGLPETKAAKYQRVLDAMQRHPELLSSARWEELLELGNTEKLTNLVSEAIRAADSENEDLLAGREVGMPEEWEDHVAHWESHSKIMQSRQFKEEADPVSRAKMKDHVYWTEEAMLDKAQKNPEFSAKLATLTLFPLFEHQGFAPPVSLEQRQALVQGQANRGNEITTVIPGTEPELK